jgi:hypothetical protein
VAEGIKFIVYDADMLLRQLKASPPGEQWHIVARRTLSNGITTRLWTNEFMVRDRRAFLSAVWYAAIGLLIGGSSLAVYDDQHHNDTARRMVFAGAAPPPRVGTGPPVGGLMGMIVKASRPHAAICALTWW